MEKLSTKKKIEYWRYSRDDGDAFWGLVGPLLTSKAFIKEFLGYPVTDEDGQQWIISMNQGAVVGLSAWLKKKNWVELTCGWVHSDFRLKGIFKTMNQLRAKQIGCDVKLRVVAYPTTQKFFFDDGFTEVSARGQFKVLEKQQ